ncbi:MAG: transcription antitermination factor NusB [Alphaproteobacteria bacterium]|nr:transcription antitermination factor NusB [Alphaproteobacteria bacterium]
MSAAPAEDFSRRLRRNARAAAVQALYQLELGGGEPAAVVAEFRHHRLGTWQDGAEIPEADEPFFAQLVVGVAGRLADLDAIIAPHLPKGRKVERLEPLLRALLRAGCFELEARGDVPARVAVDQYAGLAKDFYDTAEARLVNGVLHRLAQRLRAADMAREPPPRG